MVSIWHFILNFLGRTTRKKELSKHALLAKCPLNRSSNNKRNLHRFPFHNLAILPSRSSLRPRIRWTPLSHWRPHKIPHFHAYPFLFHKLLGLQRNQQKKRVRCDARLQPWHPWHLSFRSIRLLFHKQRTFNFLDNSNLRHLQDRRIDQELLLLGEVSHGAWGSPGG